MTNKNIKEQIQILINHFNTRNFDHVISKGKILSKKNPEYIILYNLIGSSYQSKGNYLKAKSFFKDGLKLEPNNQALMNNLATSYKNLLQYSESEELYKKIIENNKDYLNAYINLGNLKRDINKFEEAIELYSKALKINNQNPLVYYSLALANQGIGNFKETINFSEKALELDQNFTRADHLISQSIKYDKNSEHYFKLKNKLKNFNSNNLEKVNLLFSLAKAEEDIGNIQEAANLLIEGNSLKKKLLNYKVTNEINLLKEIKEKFSKIELQNSSKDANDNIIFILGMPRSGTSLIEQIITSHSQVFGAGELPILPSLVKNNFIDSNGQLKEELNELLKDNLTISNLKLEYINFIKSFKFKEKYLTDKAPLNFRWIGFIKLIFPGAKIIHCKRDPKNNCLSMFKNLFEGGLNFTYDQEDLVAYYHNYADLMDFWKDIYKDSIFDVQYESLISDQEQEIKKIIKFCDLEWEENCLSFYNNKTPIKTMSTAQARKPIYKSSLKGFDKFKDYLLTLEKNL